MTIRGLATSGSQSIANVLSYWWYKIGTILTARPCPLVFFIRASEARRCIADAVAIAVNLRADIFHAAVSF
jgi:hypothetical protein